MRLNILLKSYSMQFCEVQITKVPVPYYDLCWINNPPPSYHTTNSNEIIYYECSQNIKRKIVKELRHQNLSTAGYYNIIIIICNVRRQIQPHTHTRRWHVYVTRVNDMYNIILLSDMVWTYLPRWLRRKWNEINNYTYTYNPRVLTGKSNHRTIVFFSLFNIPVVCTF